MSADLSAPTSEASQQKDLHSPSDLPPVTASQLRTALDRPAAILPPPAPRVGKDGNPLPRRSYASMLRMRSYMSPYFWRFVSMFIFGGLSV
ncbi:MAG: hypothetical protein J2P23_12060, partial [Microlunatus sp.]|nr:hypothetical protein [Microlunatus sp.]